MLHIDHIALKTAMRSLLKTKGVQPDSIDHVTASLIQTSLRGVDSHGINLFPHYCKEIDGGRINKAPKFKIKKTAASTASMDANHAFGHHAGAVAMDQAVNFSKKTGVGAVSVKNSSHFGAASYFGFRAAEKNCLGFAFTNADALVKAYGSTEALFGTNPICFTAPMADEEPFCLDMATSLVSWNKIQNYRQSNQPIPSHWAFDEHGHSTTDPHQAKTLNPAGEYKGFGLGAMIDILCGLLANGPLSKDILSMYNSPLHEKRKINHFFMAIAIDKFTNVRTFKKRLQEMTERVRKSNPINKDSPVMIAGDPEKKNFRCRLKEGIPISESKYNEFLSLSTQFKKAIK